jgi:hypothetical protein
LKLNKVEIMSDQDRAREREHWQAIAEQLGLGPEPEPVPEKPARPVQSQTRAEVLAPLTEPDVSTEGDVFLREETQTVTAMEDEIAPETASVETKPVATERERERLPRADDQRRSGKHGRGRRQGRGEERAATGEGEEDTAQRPSTDEGNSGEERPARGHGRRQEQAKSSHQADEDEDVEVTDARAESEDESDDVEDFSHWSVPSWNELIASLYRPQR